MDIISSEIMETMPRLREKKTMNPYLHKAARAVQNLKRSGQKARHPKHRRRMQYWLRCIFRYTRKAVQVHQHHSNQLPPWLDHTKARP